jgi:hypothetical protein
LCFGAWDEAHGLVDTLVECFLEAELAASFSQFTGNLEGDSAANVGKLNGGDGGVNSLSDLVTNVNGLFDETEDTLSVLNFVLPMVAFLSTFPMLVSVLSGGVSALSVNGSLAIALLEVAGSELSDADGRSDGNKEGGSECYKYLSHLFEVFG